MRCVCDFCRSRYVSDLFYNGIIDIYSWRNALSHSHKCDHAVTDSEPVSDVNTDSNARHLEPDSNRIVDKIIIAITVHVHDANTEHDSEGDSFGIAKPFWESDVEYSELDCESECHHESGLHGVKDPVGVHFGCIDAVNDVVSGDLCNS